MNVCIEVNVNCVGVRTLAFEHHGTHANIIIMLTIGLVTVKLLN